MPELEPLQQGRPGCPEQGIVPDETRCELSYGAVMRLYYEGAAGWWYKEFIEDGGDNGTGRRCWEGGHNQNDKPTQTPDGFITDTIANYNGLPQFVAPCADVTMQTVLLAPTPATLETDACVYQNRQVIEVTLEKKTSPTAGKVITSSDDVSTSCNWEAKF
jgi:hypothetical protein